RECAQRRRFPGGQLPRSPRRSRSPSGQCAGFRCASRNEHRDLTLTEGPAPPATVGRVKQERRVAARLPKPTVREQRRDSRASPEQNEIEEPCVSSAQERADTVDGGCEAQGE